MNSDFAKDTSRRAGGHRSSGARGTPEPEVTPDELRLVHRMLTEKPLSRRGRKIGPHLHSAWIEWEMASPTNKPSYRTLARKHYGDGQKYREAVRKGITRQRRQLEDKVKQ